MEPLILASQSPARKGLLESLGWPFDVVVSGVAEDDHPVREPEKRAPILARLKAQEVASRYPGRFIVACDTLVQAPDGSLLEKPVDEDDARRMLRLQSGGASTVYSALCVALPSGELKEALDRSLVHFSPLTDAHIEWWVSHGLWKGRSGGFQVDGPGQLLIERIEGDWSAIVGLPVRLLGKILQDSGWEWTNAGDRN